MINYIISLILEDESIHVLGKTNSSHKSYFIEQYEKNKQAFIHTELYGEKLIVHVKEI